MTLLMCYVNLQQRKENTNIIIWQCRHKSKNVMAFNDLDPITNKIVTKNEILEQLISDI